MRRDLTTRKVIAAGCTLFVVSSAIVYFITRQKFPGSAEIDDYFRAYGNDKGGSARVNTRAMFNRLAETDSAEQDRLVVHFMMMFAALYRETHDEELLNGLDDVGWDRVFGTYPEYVCKLTKDLAVDPLFVSHYGSVNSEIRCRFWICHDSISAQTISELAGKDVQACFSRRTLSGNNGSGAHLK